MAERYTTTEKPVRRRGVRYQVEFDHHREERQREFDHHRDERQRLMGDLARSNANLPPGSDGSVRGPGHRPLPPTPDVQVGDK